jgi:putative NIF3 family GTP cyclohydrolase 1 type 2
VTTVGVVSGGGAGDLGEAIALGLDAFLTGEPSEFAMADAREAGIHFIAGGHYATETFGIRRLGDLLAERFGVEHRFVEVPNPV